MKRRRPAECSSPFRVTATHLLSFLALTCPTIPLVSAANDIPVQIPLNPSIPSVQQPAAQRQTFQLKQVFHHGTYRNPGLLRKFDIPQASTLCVEEDDASCLSLPGQGLGISAKPFNVQRLRERSFDAMDNLMAAGRERGSPLDLPSSAWTVDEIKGPDVTDKETVLSLARMTANAYYEGPFESSWEDTGAGFNLSNSFGWESDGLRGHLFADEKNDTVIIAFKGTSPAVFDGADTTTNDKVNDNLFFSCCCGQGGNILWRQVCDCNTATYTCNSTCLIKSLRNEGRYYSAAKYLYRNVTALYPRSDIWITGHSLGGAVSSLLGLTYGVPVVSFESPGDALAASRLGLPTPPGYRIGSDEPSYSTGGFHFGHTADPVYMGTCSSCTLASYAMESVCHTGMECRFDTVKDLGYHNYIGNHKIVSVIHDVLEVYDEMAKCEVITDCSDCFNWKFFKSNSSQTTTSPSSIPSYTRTRTETCKTPGWFGCLDESTTTSGMSSSTTTTQSTSTCKTPGWFGCLDETTTTSSTSTSTSSTTTTTSTCKTPGWFGCNDPTTTTTSTTTSTTTCQTPGWFGCNDPTTTTTSSTSSQTSTSSTTCRTPGWFGCWDPTSTTTTTSMSTSTCKTPGFFWGCWDPTTTTATTSQAPSTCKTPGFLWGCRDDAPSTPTVLTTGERAVTTPTATPAHIVTMPTAAATLHMQQPRN